MASRGSSIGARVGIFIAVVVVLRGLRAFSVPSTSSWQRQPGLSDATPSKIAQQTQLQRQAMKQSTMNGAVNGVQLEDFEGEKIAVDSKPKITLKTEKPAQAIPVLTEKLGAELSAITEKMSAKGGAAKGDKKLGLRNVDHAKKSLSSSEPKPLDKAATESKPLETTATVPDWAPLAALGAIAVAALVMVGVTISGNNDRTKTSLISTARPQLVSVSTPAPTSLSAMQVASTPATPPPPPVAQQSLAPASAPTIAQPQKPVPPTPSVRTSAAVPQAAPEASEFGWAHRLTAAVADGLRGIADALPSAERTLEQQAPAVESGVRWTSEIRPENIEAKAKEATPVVGRAVTQGADAVARAALRGGSMGAKLAAQEMPKAGQMLQGTIERAMPGIQSGARASADFARTLAEKSAELSGPGQKAPEVAQPLLKAAPTVLGGVAAGLDMFADVAPSVEAALAYGAGKAMPIVTASLEAISEVSADAAKAPLPEASQVTSSMKLVGIDTDRIGASAQGLAQEAVSKVSAALQQRASAVPKP